MKSTKKEQIQIVLIIIAMIVAAIFIVTTKVGCQTQTYTFNYRSGTQGKFMITVNKDSLHVYESFVYEEEGLKKLWQNNWSEKIVKNLENQAAIVIETSSAEWILFYCEDDQTCWSVCEMIYSPKVGEELSYKRLLKI